VLNSIRRDGLPACPAGNHPSYSNSPILKQGGVGVVVN